MRWMWIDAITVYEHGERLVAVKNVSLAEEHLHDHFEADESHPAHPVMPGCLLLEGMAQSGGVLVGAFHGFREKVVLAKVAKAELDEDVEPGQCVRYDVRIVRMDDAGSSTSGVIERLDHRDGKWREIGRVDLIFSLLDHNRAGTEFPEENFVFGENFRTILQASGLAYLADEDAVGQPASP